VSCEDVSWVQLIQERSKWDLTMDREGTGWGMLMFTDVAYYCAEFFYFYIIRLVLPCRPTFLRQVVTRMYQVMLYVQVKIQQLAQRFPN